MAQNPNLLRVLHLVTFVGETCPAYNQFALPASGLHKNSICTYFPGEERMTGQGVKLFSGDGTPLGFLRALKAALETDSYDIIHVHFSHFSVLLLLACIALRKNLLRSTVYTVHTSYPNLKLRHRLFTALSFVCYRRIVFCSMASFDSFPRLFKWLVGRRGRVVQNGVDLERIDLVAQVNTAENQADEFIVVSVGRLIEVKNTAAIIRAFQAEHKENDRLIIIGEGKLRQNIQNLIDAIGLTNHVCLTGLLSRDAVYGHLKQADLFISSSLIEGLPVAVLEAMACGCPVILSDIPPHREIANGADFIPLITPNDVNRLHQEIDRFRQMSQSQRSQIGMMCRAIVEKQFTVTRMLQEYDEIYRQLLMSRTVPQGSGLGL